MSLTIDPNRPPQRAATYWACRRCGEINDGYGTFAAGSLDDPRHYCLRHIPRLARLKERAELREFAQDLAAILGHTEPLCPVVPDWPRLLDEVRTRLGLPQSGFAPKDA